MEQITLTVSDCIALINQTLEFAYPTVVVEGEIASFKVSKGKYVFFDIKDDQGVLGCFMMIYQLRAPLEDGMKVRVVARPQLTAWGKFSLTVRELTPVGEGSIRRSFDLLKAKLQAEGLFEPTRKRRLPTIPEKIGLIASTESAGYADFLKVLHNRWGGLEIVVANVQVQGGVAAEQIINALRHFNEQPEPVEAIVLVRGGGSIEDLAVFNQEPLVRAVAGSRIPTLVGVGHEIDTSLCDLAADVRGATPSNAAELLIPDKQALLRELQHKKRHMIITMQSRSTALHKQVSATATQLMSRMQHMLKNQARQVAHAEQLLRQLDPKTVLRRGYGLVRNQQGALLKTKPQVGDKITIELNQAIIKAGVEHVSGKK